MKCQNFVWFKLSGKKKLKEKLFRSFNPDTFNEMVSDLEKSNYSVCDGKIKSNIAIDSDYGYGGEDYHTLEVSFKCQKCGNGHFKDLESNISFVKNIIDNYIEKML